MNYDVIVIGVGGVGSAIVDHLARRGVRTVGIEQFAVGNDRGSSHGHTRIIRKAYYEGAFYVPLLQRAYELWHELEQDRSEKLLVTTGGLDIGRPEDAVVFGSLESCRAHNIEHELLDASGLMRRFPGFVLPEDFVGVHQADGGFLLSEPCIAAHADRAREHGATINEHEQVLTWSTDAFGVSVHTDKGTYRADKLVLSGGAWNAALVPDLKHLMVAERQVLGWFQPTKPDNFQTNRFPVFLMAVDKGCFYGFPDFENRGLKLGLFHHLRQAVDPDTMDRECHDADEQPLRQFVSRYYDGGAGKTLGRKACMFTNTPDEHFILDHLPGQERVVLAGGFSGHGFKFASVVGEIMADLAVEGKTSHNIDALRVDRFDGV